VLKFGEVLAIGVRIEKNGLMRGSPDPQLAMLSSLSTEDLIPPDHPIRRIRVVVDAVLAELDDVFDGMYAAGGRRSVPPETLLKSSVLMAMYSIRSERAFCERLNYDLMFKWFLDMRIDQRAFGATTFTKNRQRLLEAEVADEFFAAVVDQAKLRRYVSSEHFTVGGTLLKAWASHKSFKPKDGPPSQPPAGRNAEVGFHGEKRSNETHASTTDPSQARADLDCAASPNVRGRRPPTPRRRRRRRCRTSTGGIMTVDRPHHRASPGRRGLVAVGCATRPPL
jgi:transposase